MPTIEIQNKNGSRLVGTDCVADAVLYYPKAYRKGDCIVITAPNAPCYLWVQADDAMPGALVYFSVPEFRFPVPFGRKKVCMNSKAFTKKHVLRAREAFDWEVQARRNLCCNPWDYGENAAVFPHAQASVVTRGSERFAARNAIDGLVPSAGHGRWPFSSWGINQDPQAQLTVHFGTRVCCDRLCVRLRADFPHDNWWKQATVTFSDGSEMLLTLRKTGEAQYFSFAPKTVEWVRLHRLLRDESDPSVFPALTQLELYGTPCARTDLGGNKQ